VVTVGGVVVGLTPAAVPARRDVPLHITVAFRDHAPATVDVTPVADQGLAVALALLELRPSGALEITSEPAGATVSLDGKVLGLTPLKSADLPSGEHRLALALEGFKPVTQPLRIIRQRTTKAALALERDLKHVTLLSEPSGARVWLDGTEVGVTPVDLPAVQAGPREVKLVLAAHAVLQQTVRVTGEEAEQAFRFRLRALAGNLRVETTPRGASLTVDGEDRGKTPVAITALGVGTHTVAFALDGYLPVTRSVDIADQETAAVQEELQKAEGRILCVSVPAGASINLDGADAGKTPTTLEHVSAGKRVLTLTLAGYQPWTARVPVVHGQITRVEVGLLRETQGGN
jgi:hypothetical protein